MNNSKLSFEPSDILVILLAEDDPDQSDMLRESLEEEGYAVETAFSGNVALRRLGDRRYAAAIMDVRMPGIHGSTILSVFKALDLKTPVIMVSAFITPEDMEKYKRDGAAASFSKPLDVPRLMRFLRTVTHTNTP